MSPFPSSWSCACPPLGEAGCKAGCRIFSTVCRGHTHRVLRGSGAAPLPVMTPDAPMHLRRVLRAMLNFGHARPRHAPRQRRPARAPRTRLRPKWRCSLYTALRVLGRDQSVEMRSVRSYSVATKVDTRSVRRWLSSCRVVDAQNGHERRKSGAVMGSFVFERSQSRVVERV